MIYEIEQLKDQIDDAIHENGNKEITGAILNNTLKDIVDTLGQGRSFAAIINSDSAEPEHDGTVFYVATEKGTYFPDAQFPVVIEEDGINILFWNFYVGRWTRWNVINNNVSVAFLDDGEISGRVLSDASHDIIADGMKFRVIVGSEERVAGRNRRSFLFCRHTSQTDYYITPPEYNDHDGEMVFYMIELSNTRDAEADGFPYTMKMLAVGGASEAEI